MCKLIQNLKDIVLDLNSLEKKLQKYKKEHINKSSRIADAAIAQKNISIKKIIDIENTVENIIKKLD